MLLLLLFLASCSTALHQSFREIDAGPFTLSLPANLKTKPVSGIDSLVGRYEASGIEVAFDYGAYSNRLEHQERKGYTRSEEIIDGRQCALVAWEEGGRLPYYTAIHCPATNSGWFDANGLTLFVNYADPDLAKSAQQICRSVKFKTAR